MTEHPDDTPVKRFFAFWWALGAILVFGVLALVIGGVDTLVGGGKDEYTDLRAEERYAKLAEVVAAQRELLNGAGQPVEGGKIRIPVDVAAQVVLKELQSIPPGATPVPVPGTAAMEELMKKQAEEAAAAEAAKPKEEKPKEEAPQGAKPEEAKPQEAK